MFDKLEHKYHRTWMDNLYNSAKVFKDAWNHPKCVMISGVTRKGLLGLHAWIRQDECKTPIAMACS